MSRLFTDHATLALAAHVAQAYGGMQTVARPVQGGLAPWQEKRGKEMLSADLAGETPLQDIARACGLSLSHFSRAFRRSIGFMLTTTCAMITLLLSFADRGASP